MDAYQGRWRLMLHCQRSMEAFKATKPCPGPVEISVATLKASFYWATPLERLRHKLHCPSCESRTWIVPDPAEPPAPKESPNFLLAHEKVRRRG